MKTRHAVLLVTLAGFAVVVGQKAIPAKDAGEEGIPIPSGHFSRNIQGYASVCLDPTTLAEEPCSISGVEVFPFRLLNIGAATIDSKGKSCDSNTEVDANLPLVLQL